MYRNPLPVYRNPVILNKLSLRRTSSTSGRIQGTAVTWRPEKEGAGSDEVAKETASKVDPISLPPVHLPQKLQDAVGRVLSKYPSKSLRQDGELLVGNLVSRRPPISHALSRASKPPAKQSPPDQMASKEILQQGEVKQDLKDEDSGAGFEEGRKYRRSKYSPLRYGTRESVAYVASRLNATYASTYRVLHEISVKCPNFQPETLLDFGSGVGTTVWVASELWKDSIYEYQCIDVSEEAEEVAKELRTSGITDSTKAESVIPNVYFKQYLPLSNDVTYDLVVAAYSLSDIPTIGLRKSTIRNLWKKVNTFLVLIDVGNFVGYSIMMEARNMLLSESQGQTGESSKSEVISTDDGHVLAPCPHDKPCPLLGSKQFCHFGQRSQLSFTERNSPLRKYGFHIEKFAYLIMQKGARKQTEAMSRVLKPVKKRSRHLICTACCPDGEARDQVISKGKSRIFYKAVRSSKWGDCVEMPSIRAESDES